MQIFLSKIEELNMRVGFGSIKKDHFEHCGRQYVKDVDGNILVNMKPFAENLEKVEITKERAKEIDSPLTAAENHSFRGGNGSLQWLAKELFYFLQFPVKVLQRRQDHATVKDLLKLNGLIEEAKNHKDFILRYVLYGFKAYTLEVGATTRNQI